MKPELSGNLARIEYNPTTFTLRCSGSWTVTNLSRLEQRLSRQISPPQFPTRILDATDITRMDTGGAWLLKHLIIQLEQQRFPLSLEGIRPEHQKLLQLVKIPSRNLNSLPLSSPGKLENLGRLVWTHGEEALSFLAFLGETLVYFFRSAINPSRIRWRSFLSNLQTAGIYALPIIGLLIFLIGIVLAYQGGIQLRYYGANIFIVELVTVTMVQELSPLMAAIITAGRTGSAFTAQIGTMQVTEEIDALRTLGVPPLDQLVLPKLFALMLALPLLTVFADIMGTLGGMVMAQTLLGVEFREFAERIPQVVPLSSFLIGVGKALVFAAIIALVGCYQGFRVQGSAESVGRRTTASVVQAIFLVIIADAAFSILFTWLGIGWSGS
jgi:phospholipid/cholesterol/gamma-HCH transport system permease protein